MKLRVQLSATLDVEILMAYLFSKYCSKVLWRMRDNMVVYFEATE
jgi:hypothetical protein